MGAWLSYVWWGGDPDQPDEVSGLSLRDLHLLRKSWIPIYKHPIDNGTEILKRLFRADSDIRPHFKMLAGTPESDSWRLPQFRAHVLNLMSSLNQVVVTLDQPILAGAILDRIGESHNRRKISKRHFEVLQAVLVTLFTELGLDRDTLAA